MHDTILKLHTINEKHRKLKIKNVTCHRSPVHREQVMDEKKTKPLTIKLSNGFENETVKYN